MKKTELATALLLCIVVSTLSCAGVFGKWKEPEPTAIVVDAETGEPVEGAVGLAVWWGEAAVGAFEGGGGVSVTKRVGTSVSDEKGRIYIDDFWDWHMFKSDYPHLTVYKCGYICWNQYRIYKPGPGPDGYRYDFGKKNRIVRLKKRPENFSFISHDEFISHYITMHGSLGRIRPFDEAYDGCEMQKRVDERTEENKKIKKEKKKKEDLLQ